MPTEKAKILACALALSSTVAIAQEVELYTSDGSVNVRGQLIEFVDQKYTIDTFIGRMTLDSDTLLCKGEACPALNSSIPALSIVGVGMQASIIVPQLLPSFAQSIGVQVDEAVDGTYSLANAQDEEIATISVSDTASSNNLPGLLQEQPDIALSSIPLFSEDVSELNPGQQTDQSTDNNQVIGLNAITIVTAKDNPIHSISTSDVAKVFSGEYDNWSELGGPDSPIVLYGPQTDSELAKQFRSQIAGTREDEATQVSQEIVTTENIAEQVASDPNGIGYTYFTNSRAAKTLDIQGVCGMASPANSFTIKAEEYPLTQRFYAYRLTQRNLEHTDALLSFIQSDTGQDIVRSHGLVNQRDTDSSIKNQGIRFVNAIAASTSNAESELLREMATQIIGSKRLSTTFRFETGSNQMAQRAQADIVRLAEKLQSPENTDNVVHLLGFTDSVGDFDLNQEVSLRRANQVRDALIEIDTALAERISLQSAGFGEIAPIACNETSLGRSINRRVEVWIGKG